jgi:UDP-N-acetylmuramyl pentapeptide phosphotransferase/UDP-N-acetylglucosamine-1-phosphate transferase
MATRDEDDDEDRVIYHPNQEKASSKATKAIVVLLLIVSAVLTLLITIGGWSNLQGAKIFSVFFILVFFVMAYFVANWYRGVLPLAAGLSVILGVFAAIAAFGTGNWFDRSNDGYNKSGLPPDLIGLLCVVLLPVLVLLIAFSMRAFAQKWNIEIEMSREEFEQEHRGGRGGGSYGGAQPAGA